MRLIRKYGSSLLVITVMIAMFSFGAVLEYRHTIEEEQASLREELINVKTNIENMITARIINADGMAGFIQLNKGLNQEAYDIFAEGIYKSESHLVKDVVFITDTTITYVFPRFLGEGAIGVDLGKVPDQKDLLLYTKEFNETVFFGPVDLVEGGQGIIVRVPVVVDASYYGQVAIVFDYPQFIKVSGLENLSDKYNLILSGNNPIENTQSHIWTSGSLTSTLKVTEKINLYNIEWVISGEPSSGWHGRSLLFNTIIIIGVILTFGAGVTYHKEVQLKEALEVVNKGLYKTVAQLADSQIELTEKYEEIKEKESYIQHLADHDVLTDTFNRRLFEEDLETSLKVGEEGLVILIDIDDFKNINDIHGHIYGDRLLKEFAITLSQVIPPLGRMYRFGGDEFLILLRDNYDDDNIRQLARTIRNAVEAKVSGSHGNAITISAGGVRYPSQGKDVESLLIRADVAMYRSKNSGKNKMTIFEESLLAALDNKIAIETHIKSALANDQFTMHYQPIVSAASGEIISFEALIRLKDKSYSPAEFIEVAETTGFIIPLGYWILDEVFNKISKWIDMGIETKPIAINLSPKQLIQPEFRNEFFRRIGEAGFPMAYIEIEITENILLENEEKNLGVLRALRHAGVKVSMDDFGTGYSSLKYLTYLPIDKVKIDKSLKDQLIKMDNSRVLSGIITMVHGLGMKVVAEGIENEEEWEQLREVGCDYLQGYLFSRPVPASNIEMLLKESPFKKSD